MIGGQHLKGVGRSNASSRRELRAKVVLTVRHATTEDAGSLARLYKETLPDAYAGISLSTTLSEEAEAERAQRFHSTIVSESRLWLVAEHDGIVVGFCGLAPARDQDVPRDFGEVTTITVHRRFRGRGYGSALLTAAREAAVERNWSSLVLWVVGTNADARSFYERNGFKPDGASRVDRRLGMSARILRYRRTIDGV